MKRIWNIMILAGLVTAGATVTVSGCASFKSVLAVDEKSKDQRPIADPFNGYNSASAKDDRAPMILRTKKGDRSIEVEFPRDQTMTDFVLPLSPAFGNSTRSPASEGGSNGTMDESYVDQAPGISDREIAASMPQTLSEDSSKRNEIETGLGLMSSDEAVPQRDKSYLASLDHVKQLFKIGRYEAGLMEVDSLLHNYQTDPKLYEMRGTLLDRIGRTDLAIKSWTQALRLEPKNQSLRRFLERRQQNRSVASP